MTQDEIIRMAREAGLKLIEDCCDVPEKFCAADVWKGNLASFAALVAAHEREKEIKRVAEGHGWTQAHWTAYEESIAAAERELCAKVCERLISGDGMCADDGVWIHDCAAAIRARGEK